MASQIAALLRTEGVKPPQGRRASAVAIAQKERFDATMASAGASRIALAPPADETVQPEDATVQPELKAQLYSRIDATEATVLSQLDELRAQLMREQAENEKEWGKSAERHSEVLRTQAKASDTVESGLQDLGKRAWAQEAEMREVKRMGEAVLGAIEGQQDAARAGTVASRKALDAEREEMRVALDRERRAVREEWALISREREQREVLAAQVAEVRRDLSAAEAALTARRDEFAAIRGEAERLVADASARHESTVRRLNVEATAAEEAHAKTAGDLRARIATLEETSGRALQEANAALRAESALRQEELQSAHSDTAAARLELITAEGAFQVPRVCPPTGLGVQLNHHCAHLTSQCYLPLAACLFCMTRAVCYLLTQTYCLLLASLCSLDLTPWHNTQPELHPTLRHPISCHPIPPQTALIEAQRASAARGNEGARNSPPSVTEIAACLASGHVYVLTVYLPTSSRIKIPLTKGMHRDEGILSALYQTSLGSPHLGVPNLAAKSRANGGRRRKECSGEELRERDGRAGGGVGDGAAREWYSGRHDRGVG